MEHFICLRENPKTHTQERWPGVAQVIRETPNVVEAMVEARGTHLDVIVGKYYGGNFICIPNIDVGCSLSTWWDDIFWNTEKLSSRKNEVDAVTAAYAVKALMFDRVQKALKKGIVLMAKGEKES